VAKIVMPDVAAIRQHAWLSPRQFFRPILEAFNPQIL